MSLNAINEDVVELSLSERWVETLEWLKLLAMDPSLTSIYELQDGIALIRAMNQIEPDIVPSYHELEVPEDQTIHPLIKRENLNFYIEACWKLGIPSHKIFIASDILDDEERLVESIINNIAAISQAAQYLSKFNPDYAGIPPLGTLETRNFYSILMFEYLPEDYEFGNEDMDLQAALCQMIREIFESFTSGSETDMKSVDSINDNAFAVDAVRRVYVHLLREMVFHNKTGPQVVTLNSHVFSVIATMTSSLLKELRVNTGGDYFTAKLLFNLSFYIKTTSNIASVPGDIYLHEVIRENKVWEYTSFWTEFYWDSASAALGSQVRQLVSVNDIDTFDDDQKVFLFELLYDHVQKMYEWGGMSVDVLVVFVESISPFIDLTEEDEQDILEHALSHSLI